MLHDLALDLMPSRRPQPVDDVLDAIDDRHAGQNKHVLLGMLPSVGRGSCSSRASRARPCDARLARGPFDFHYDGDYPEMYDLYRRAVPNQWDADKKLDWSTDVDPQTPSAC